MNRLLLVLISALTLQGLSVPTPVPKEAVKALQITKGKPCRTGVVFMDGKYIVPPYVVKRYGTAIMINDVQVTAPLVSWEEFVKTQDDVQVTRTETPVPEQPAIQAMPQSREQSVEVDPLADLFDDNSKPAEAKKNISKPRVHASPKTTATTMYVMSGDFVPNDASKALVEKINRHRTDVNAWLTKGGFIFFGTGYSRVSGGAREAKRLLDVLPQLMRTCESGSQMLSELRRHNIYYLTEPIANDLVRNRYLYPQIEVRVKQMSEDEKIDALMRGTFR